MNTASKDFAPFIVRLAQGSLMTGHGAQKTVRLIQRPWSGRHKRVHGDAGLEANHDLGDVPIAYLGVGLVDLVSLPAARRLFCLSSPEHVNLNLSVVGETTPWRSTPQDQKSLKKS